MEKARESFWNCYSRKAKRPDEKEITAGQKKPAQEAQGVVEDSTPLSFCSYKEPKPGCAEALAGVYDPGMSFDMFDGCSGKQEGE